MATAEPHQARWAYAEWLDLARRRFRDGGALLYSPDTGRAAVLAPRDGGGTMEVLAVLGMRWRPGKTLSRRSLRGLRPLAGVLRVTAVASTAPVDLAALKRRHLLAEVVEGAGVELRGRGRVRQGVCPFHEEREGSFTVYGDTERWYCFGCGEGGDVLDFIQRAEGLSLPEAIRRLDAAPPTAVVSLATAGQLPRRFPRGTRRC